MNTLSLARKDDGVEPRPGVSGALPHSIDAEQSLLGCVMYDNAAYERVPDSLKAADFYEPFHARLWAEIEAHIRRGQLADPVVLMERFRSDEAFEELGGLAYLAQLVDAAPPAFNALDYAKVVRGLSLRRAMIRIGGEMAGAATSDHDSEPEELLEQAEGDLYALAEAGQQSGGIVSFEDACAKAIEGFAAAYSRDGGLSGLSTGLIDLDQKLGGLHPSDLIILAARPSMGKTALGTNIAFQVARHYAWEQQPDGSRKTINGGQVLFFSLEMSEEQLAGRVLAEVAEISGDRLRRGDIDAVEFGRVRDAALEIGGAPLSIDATGGLALAKLCARARRMKRSKGLDLIVVDYLQLVTTGGRENRVQEVSAITGGLKALAKELNVPIVALSQLSRQVENREDKRPQLSDLRESGSIEQDADVVMFLYREEYYLGRAEPKADTPEHLNWCEQMDQCRGIAELIIGKQRHGPIGTVRLSFQEAYTRFGNIARDGRYDAMRNGGRPDKAHDPSKPRFSFGGDQ